ncbi:MAG: hypothetical protein JRI23_19455 [Deltaproteobacteria bacterium]|jgi:hypothetical protein|nr:hypothetical protein [Deltaproteobacteria bacterium]MBW2534042.1 hypothetical protein [Deltaproteobacteria bacterium]
MDAEFQVPHHHGARARTGLARLLRRHRALIVATAQATLARLGLAGSAHEVQFGTLEP